MNTCIFPNSMQSVTTTTGNHVAVLMRTKDRPILLARAFASVLSQIHTNWHVYVVNDGGNPSIVNTLIKQYETAFEDRLTVIHHETSKGMEAASNAALTCSHSDFVVVHDDDDSWHPEFLSTTTAFLNQEKNSSYAAVISHYVLVYERIEGNICIEEERSYGHLSPMFIDFGAMLQSNLFPPISLLIRRTVIDQIGKFNSAMPVLGDWDYNLRIMTVGDIGVIPRELAYYHHRRASNDIYGNTVISGVDNHRLHHSLYSNSFIRHLSQISPSQFELIFAIAQMLRNIPAPAQHHDTTQHLQNQINQLAVTIEQIATTARSVSQGLRPARWVWRKLFPLRHAIAKLRGRI